MIEVSEAAQKQLENFFDKELTCPYYSWRLSRPFHWLWMSQKTAMKPLRFMTFIIDKE